MLRGGTEPSAAGAVGGFCGQTLDLQDPMLEKCKLTLLCAHVAAVRLCSRQVGSKKALLWRKSHEVMSC